MTHRFVPDKPHQEEEDAGEDEDEEEAEDEAGTEREVDLRTSNGDVKTAVYRYKPPSIVLTLSHLFARLLL